MTPQLSPPGDRYQRLAELWLAYAADRRNPLVDQRVVLAVAARTVVARRLISPVDLEGLAADLDVDLDVVLSTLEQLRAAWLIWWTPGGGVVSVRP